MNYIAYFCQKILAMKLRILLVFLLIFMVYSCQKDTTDQQFLIAKDRIGNLTKGAKINQLDSIFAGDSVVNKNNTKEFSNGNEIIIYQKGGRELLRLYPAKSFDSTSTISEVEVIDTIYKTAEGLGRGSNFEVIKENYNISRIENTLGTAMVFIDELNIHLDIDKKEISEPKGMGVKLKSSQIKNKAKVKYLWLDWN